MSKVLDELEAQKLQLEINELKKYFWQRAGFLVPLSAALISLCLGYYSGWFDVQTKLLEIKRFELNEEIDKFTKEKVRLIAEQKVLVDQVNIAKRLRNAQSRYISTEVLRFKELMRNGTLPNCDECEVFFEAIEKRFYSIKDSDLQAELELIDFELNNEDEISERERKLIDYMNKREMLDDDGCFEDDYGETHCTNF